MKKEEIKERLKEYYDDLSSSMLTDCLIDFEELFNGKYRTIDQNIELLVKNIPKGIVEYDELEDDIDATCSISSGEFKILKSALEKKDYFNYIFFHEFLHSITFESFNGKKFLGFYTIENGEEYRFKSRSFNEAFTEYLTLKRNKLYNYKVESGSLSGYDVGANQLLLLTRIIPEEELINSFFNCPDKLEEILNKYEINMDEIFYAFYVFQGKELDVKALEEKRGIHNVSDLFKIISGSRYIFYNLSYSLGEVRTKEDFHKKWNILLTELEDKYNFYKIDGLYRYGELVNDIDKLNISDDDPIYDKVSYNTVSKYRFLNDIFNNENKMMILEKLYNIYSEDYKKYGSLVWDDLFILPYIFLDNIKNNYQISDIEIYPRVFPFLKKENTNIEDVVFKKYRCDEDKISFYVFDIKGSIFIDTNYDDTEVFKINNDEFEIKYDNIKAILNLKDKKYVINDNTYELIELY